MDVDVMLPEKLWPAGVPTTGECWASWGFVSTIIAGRLDLINAVNWCTGYRGADSN